jgi:hypothetical protein
MKGGRQREVEKRKREGERELQPEGKKKKRKEELGGGGVTPFNNPLSSPYGGVFFFEQK